MRMLRHTRWVLSLVFSGFVAVAVAQTPITAPKNKYTPAEDVKLGREAAAQAEQELPILRDSQVTSFIEDVGRRLLDQAPAEFRHDEFRYSFKVVNQPQINAFALPGGPTYFNRGMITAAKNEGEVAGVLAHELSHVLLRHGTAQATKATPYALGQMAGQILGAIVGGKKGQVIGQVSEIGIGTAFLRFGREYEKQADLLGAQIMARAGYNPVDMANMFRTIAKQGGGGAPEFLSSHPDPGNRYDYVMKEAQMLRVTNARRDTGEFNQVRARLGSNAVPAVVNAGARSGGPVRTGNPGDIEEPSNDYRTYTVDNAFQVSVPENWRQVPGTNGATFAPDGAYTEGSFSHGVEIGLAQTGATLQAATNTLIAGFRKGNPQLRALQSRATTVDGREAIETVMSNDGGGLPEAVRIITTMPTAQRLAYVVTVVPQQEERRYLPAFQQILRSLRFAR
jgi:Zn-dependent protease with chaperone function